MKKNLILATFFLAGALFMADASAAEREAQIQKINRLLAMNTAEQLKSRFDDELVNAVVAFQAAQESEDFSDCDQYVLNVLRPEGDQGSEQEGDAERTEDDAESSEGDTSDLDSLGFGELVGLLRDPRNRDAVAHRFVSEGIYSLAEVNRALAELEEEDEQEAQSQAQKETERSQERAEQVETVYEILQDDQNREQTAQQLIQQNVYPEGVVQEALLRFPREGHHRNRVERLVQAAIPTVPNVALPGEGAQEPVQNLTISLQDLVANLGQLQEQELQPAVQNFMEMGVEQNLIEQALTQIAMEQSQESELQRRDRQELQEEAVRFALQESQSTAWEEEHHRAQQEKADFQRALEMSRREVNQDQATANAQASAADPSLAARRRRRRQQVQLGQEKVHRVDSYEEGERESADNQEDVQGDEQEPQQSFWSSWKNKIVVGAALVAGAFILYRWLRKRS